MKINKKNENKAITLPESIELDMGDRTVILEKGDRIKVVENTKFTISDIQDDLYDTLDDITIYVSETYENWDEESLEMGDTDDRGFNFEDEDFTPAQLFRHMEREGYMNPSNYPVSLRNADNTWISTEPEMDMYSGDSEILSLHFSRKNKDPRAVEVWYELLKHFSM